MKTRRHFLAGLTTAAAASWTQTLRSAPDPKKDIVIGHGRHQYKVIKDWVAPGQGRHHPILNCHEMVQVKDGRLITRADLEKLVETTDDWIPALLEAAIALFGAPLGVSLARDAETEHFEALLHMAGQVGGDIDFALRWRVDLEPPGVEMELAADPAGQERLGAPIFAVADDGVADRRHVGAKLVRSAGQRLELDPGGTIAGAVDDSPAGLRRLAMLVVDMHFLAACPGLFGERRVDHPLVGGRNAHHQRPVDFLRRAPRKTL